MASTRTDPEGVSLTMMGNSVIDDISEPVDERGMDYFQNTWMTKRVKAESKCIEFCDIKQHKDVIACLRANSGYENQQIRVQIRQAKKLRENFKHFIPHTDSDQTDGEERQILVPTVVFGSVKIPVSFTLENSAVSDKSFSRNYLLLHDNTSPEDIWNLLTKSWKIPKPDIIISLISGTVDTKTLGTKPLESLENCLRKLGTETGIWILSDGMHYGASLFLSEKLRVEDDEIRQNGDISLIGIPQWNKLDSQRLLLWGMSLENYCESCYFHSQEYTLRQGEAKHLMNPYQNVYLLEDNSGEQISGQLRSELIKFMRTRKPKKNEKSEDFAHKGVAFVPTISLLVGGNEDEEHDLLQQVEQSVRNKLAVVILADSGVVTQRLKKLFFDLECVQRRLTVYASDLTDEEMQVIHEQTRDFDSSKRDLLCTIMKHRFYLTILEADGSSIRESELIEAFYKGEKYNESVMAALLGGSLAFLDTILFRLPPSEGPIYVSDDTDLEKLHTLNLRKSSQTQQILFDDKQIHCTNKECFSVVGLVLFLLLGYRYRLQFADKRELVKITNDSRTQCWHLFLYAIISNKSLGIVKCLALNTKTPLGAFIFAYKLYKAMSVKAHKVLEQDLASKFVNNAEECLFIAKALINQMYADDPKEAHCALKRRLPFNLGSDITVLVLAVDSEARSFLKTPCCQTFIERIWLGELRPCWWRQMVALLFPVVGWLALIGILKSSVDQGTVEKKDDKDEDGDNQKKEVKEQKEDNCCVGYFKTAYKSLKCFYSVPATKFWFDLILYVLFLFVFSYFLVTDLHPIHSVRGIKTSEWLLYLFILGRILEECVQATMTPDMGPLSDHDNVKLKSSVWSRANRFRAKFSPIYKVVVYLSEGTWNSLDTVMLLFFIVSTVCRFTISYENFQLVRFFFCVTIILFYTRFLRYLYIFSKIGPRVIAITMMLRELGNFSLVLCVFHVGFGVAFQALLSPGEEVSWHVVADIFYRTYWQMYGELFLEDAETKMGREIGNYSCMFLKEHGQPELNCHSYLPFLFLAVYLFISNVLLLNVLIAIFGNTLNIVEEKSGVHWAFERFIIVHEYYYKSWLPSPFNLIWYPLVLGWHLCCCLHRRRKGLPPMETQWTATKDAFHDEAPHQADKLQRNAMRVLKRSNTISFT